MKTYSHLILEYHTQYYHLFIQLTIYFMDMTSQMLLIPFKFNKLQINFIFNFTRNWNS